MSGSRADERVHFALLSQSQGLSTMTPALSLASALLQPKNLAVISTYTREIARSTAIEQIIKTVVADDASGRTHDHPQSSSTSRRPPQATQIMT